MFICESNSLWQFITYSHLKHCTKFYEYCMDIISKEKKHDYS